MFLPQFEKVRNWRGCSRGPQGGWRRDIWGKAENTVTVQFRKVIAQGDLITFYLIPKKVAMKIEKIIPVYGCIEQEAIGTSFFRRNSAWIHKINSSR